MDPDDSKGTFLMPVLGKVIPDIEEGYHFLEFEENFHGYYRPVTTSSFSGRVIVETSLTGWVVAYSSTDDPSAMAINCSSSEEAEKALHRIFSHIFENTPSDVYESFRGEGVHFEPLQNSHKQDGLLGIIEMVRQSKESSEWRGQFSDSVRFLAFNHTRAQSTLYLFINEDNGFLELFPDRIRDFHGHTVVEFNHDTFGGVLAYVHTWWTHLYRVSKLLGNPKASSCTLNQTPWTQRLIEGVL